MSFGLTNSPATFYNLMNDILYEYLDSFVMVYLNDIVVYSDSLKSHLKPLRVVFSRLRKYQLYVKKEKCELCCQYIMFLGHLVRKGKIHIDGKKVQAILDWPAPTKVPNLRCFLGLVNDKPWCWTGKCVEAFKGLNQVMAMELEVHLVAFARRKLKDCEQRYSTHKKEMAAVTQKKLTPKKARWQEFLLKFDFDWVHIPGKLNQLADVLSHKEVKEFVATLTLVHLDFLDWIRDQSNDSAYIKLQQQVREGLVRRYWLEEDLLYAKGGRSAMGWTSWS
ncbi:unnamed protein product [Prunus armeniaca]